MAANNNSSNGGAAAAAAAAPSPVRPAAPSPALTESPGNWKHPRLAEITRRQGRGAFGERNARQIMYNVATMALLYVLRSVLAPIVPVTMLPPEYRSTASWLGLSLYLLPLANMAAAAWPLLRAPDNLADIPLTPGQRKLLGLPPVTNACRPAGGPSGGAPRPDTPESTYSTPPRYSRTPSIAGGSPPSAGARPAFGSGGENGKGDSINNNKTMSPYSPSASALAAAASGSPLFHRAAGAASGAREGLIIAGSGSGSPFMFFNNNNNNSSNSRSNSLSRTPMRRGSYGGSASGLFGDGAAAAAAVVQGTPSPTSGKRSSVALNNKWLYERGRRISGNGPAWLQHRDL